MNRPRDPSQDPSEGVERAFARIWRERMADVPIVNPVLAVEAVDFQPWQGHWLGIVVTPWCMSVLLVRGGSDGWTWASDNQRRFVKFPFGDLAMLGSDEPELGQFLSCALFSPMDRFSSPAEARATARASMRALLYAPPGAAAANSAVPGRPSRRRFLGMGENSRT